MYENKKTKRIQFDFSPEAIDKLNKLVEATDCTSKAEIIRHSLRLFEYTIEMQSKGYELKYENGNECVTVAPWINVKNYVGDTGGMVQREEKAVNAV